MANTTKKKTGSAGTAKLPGDQATSSPKLPADALASVTVRLDRKISDGDYGSMGISVGVSYPCRPGDVDKTYEGVLKWVKDKMERETGKLKDG